MAVLVGNNAGSGVRRPLRYAEVDARRLGDVLSELGGFRPENVHVLAGRTLPEVIARLDELGRQIQGWRNGGSRVVLLFYFSGHSDGQALELGTDRWSYRDVLDRLKNVGADIRIAVVDSCQSGGLLAHKGGTPGPTFDIRFTNDLATTGEAVLTSSAADEMALESREIRASFFSHHLISGLRGAADSSGDGRVTLSEAYRHAFVNTLLATSGTLTGPQHPGYDYRISGQDELVLTDVVARGSTLTLPGGFDQILIADENQRHLVAELNQRSANRIALPPGRYWVQGRRAGRVYDARVNLAGSESRALALQEFRAGSSALSAAKGDLGLVESSGLLALGAEATLVRGAADALPWLAGLRLTVRSSDRRGLGGGVEVATGRATGFRETSARAFVSAFTGREWGRLGSQLGWRLIGGVISQHVDEGPTAGTPARTYWGWMAGTGPWLAGTVRLAQSWLLSLGAGADGATVRRDGHQEFMLAPHAAAGLGVVFD
jgi:hypothetical protein